MIIKWDHGAVLKMSMAGLQTIVDICSETSNELEREPDSKETRIMQAQMIAMVENQKLLIGIYIALLENREKKIVLPKLDVRGN